MLTTLLVLAAVGLVVLLVAVVWQMSASPLWCVYHLFCGTVGFLLNGLVLVVQGIAECASGSSS